MRSTSLLLAMTVMALWAGGAAAQEGVRWQTDLEAARRMAANSDRLVLIHFWATWCHWCKPLENEVFNQPGIGPALEAHYVPVKLNYDEHRETADRYGIRYLPWDVVITPGGELVKDIKSPTSVQDYIGTMTGIARAYRQQAQALQASQPGGQIAQTGPQGPLPGQPGAAAGQSLAAAPQGPRPQPAMQLDPVAPPLANQVQPPQADPSAPPQEQVYLGDRYSSKNLSARANSAASPRDYQAPALYPPQNPSQRPAPDRDVHRSAPQSGQPAPQPGIGLAQPPLVPGRTGQTLTPALSHGEREGQPQVEAASGAPTAIPPGNPPLALEGFCPVHLAEQTAWTPGDARWGAIHEGRTYLFASQACQQKFLANPGHYSPVLSGNDPVALVDRGQTVPGRREHGCFFGSAPHRRIVLFSSEASYQAFEQNPGRYAPHLVGQPAAMAGRQN